MFNHVSRQGEIVKFKYKHGVILTGKVVKYWGKNKSGPVWLVAVNKHLIKTIPVFEENIIESIA